MSNTQFKKPLTSQIDSGTDLSVPVETPKKKSSLTVRLRKSGNDTMIQVSTDSDDTEVTKMAEHTKH